MTEKALEIPAEIENVLGEIPSAHAARTRRNDDEDDGKHALLFLDFETTGFDPEEGHVIIQVGAVRIEHREGVPIEMGACEANIQFTGPLDPGVAELIQYDPREWSRAVSIDVALSLLHPLMADAVPAGWNVAFDLKHLEHAYAALNWRMPRWKGPPLDVMSLAWPLKPLGEITSQRLGVVAKHLGAYREGERLHHALTDARLAARIYHQCMTRYYGARLRADYPPIAPIR